MLFFLSFCFFTSSYFTLFHLILFHFISLHFTLFHFPFSFHFLFHFVSFYFTLFGSFSFLSQKVESSFCGLQASLKTSCFKKSAVIFGVSTLGFRRRAFLPPKWASKPLREWRTEDQPRAQAVHVTSPTPWLLSCVPSHQAGPLRGLAVPSPENGPQFLQEASPHSRPTHVLTPRASVHRHCSCTRAGQGALGALPRAGREGCARGEGSGCRWSAECLEPGA